MSEAPLQALYLAGVLLARYGALVLLLQQRRVHPLQLVCVDRHLVRSGFRVQGSRFRVQGSGFKVKGSGFKVQGSGFRGQGLGLELERTWTKVRKWPDGSFGVWG